MDKIGLLAYKIALPEYIGHVHDVFDICSLKKSFDQ